MKNFFQNRVTIAILSFILGAACVFLLEKVWQPKRMPLAKVDSFLEDPFEEMRRMRQRMFQDFDHGSEVNEISQREDSQNIYYDIAVKGLKNEKVDVQVQDGQILISGRVERRESNGEREAFSTSSFHRSLPLPDNVDSGKVQMSQEKNKIVLVFPKIASNS